MSHSEPTVALVFSPEQWVEDLHRHLSHHGGARVRQIVVEPASALDEDYDVLVVSDRWPSLTLGFVGAVRKRQRQVLGVFEPDEPAGKDHLLTLGVDATIAADSTMTEFVAAVAVLAAGCSQHSRRPMPNTEAEHHESSADLGPLLLVSGPRGGGVTELALGLACVLADRRQRVALIDAHACAPSVAGRLGLGIEPNLRNAVDAHVHGIGPLDEAVVALASPAPRGLGVVPGFPSSVAAAQVTTREVLDVAGEMRGGGRVVVTDADDASPTSRALLGACTAVVAVVAASPIGVVRALDWIGDARRDAPIAPLHVVVNRAPTSRFRQEEVRREILRSVTPTSLTWVPADRRVDTASWNGEPVGGGPFRAAVGRLADAVVPGATRRRGWRR